MWYIIPRKEAQTQKCNPIKNCKQYDIYGKYYSGDDEPPGYVSGNKTLIITRLKMMINQ